MNVLEGKKYKHKVKGTVYLVLHIAQMEVDEAPCVVYKDTSEELLPIWVRPLDEFKTRFERVS